MLAKLKEKVKKLLKRDIKKDKHEEMLLKMKKRLKALEDKKSSDIKEEIIIIETIIKKLEKNILK